MFRSPRYQFCTDKMQVGWISHYKFRYCSICSMVHDPRTILLSSNAMPMAYININNNPGSVPFILRIWRCIWQYAYLPSRLHFFLKTDEGIKTSKQPVQTWAKNGFKPSRNFKLGMAYLVTFAPSGNMAGNSIHLFRIYIGFANSCPLQTDTFLFPLIYSHKILLSSNKF